MLLIMTLLLNSLSISQLMIILRRNVNTIVHERKYVDLVKNNRHDSYWFIFLIMLNDETNTCEIG